MNDYDISYNPETAIHIGSAVAAILARHIVRKCNEAKMKCIIAQDVQFELGFSDVEFYSALKTLRETGYMKNSNVKGGAMKYTPLIDLLDDDIQEAQ